MQLMMQDGMMHGSMLWGIGIGWILILLFLVLGIAAFFRRPAGAYFNRIARDKRWKSRVCHVLAQHLPPPKAVMP